MCLFKSPKVPEVKQPTLPRQPIIAQKPASFRPANLTKKDGLNGEEDAAIGFGATGRAGARGLRIKRLRSDSVAGLGNITGMAMPGSPLAIGAQVPV